MIFLSSQPDDFFFLWQLQLQIFNFVSLGIKPQDIHILIGYDPTKGLHLDYQKFIDKHLLVNIHAYPDTRESKTYAPSLRWHIIAKHLIAFPSLQNETVFHHDSDIVFKSLPNFGLMEDDNVWYASDTRSYLSSSYINSTSGKAVFNEMCNVVGVTPKQVQENDANAGGAQYLIKRMSIEFLNKMEKDSEDMYKLLTAHNRKERGFCDAKNDYSMIQAWTADMWVIWWTSIFFEQEFRIHPELDFAWIGDPIEKLDSCKTLHYTGKVEKDKSGVFRKGDYQHYSPFFQNLSNLDEKGCSGFLKILISRYVENEKGKRLNLTDFTFVVPVLVKTKGELENVNIILANITANYKARVLLIETGPGFKLNPKTLPVGVEYYKHDCEPENGYARFKKLIVENISTPYFAIYHPSTIIPFGQVTEAANKLRGSYSAIIPYSGAVLKVDSLLKTMFTKINDDLLLEENQNKLLPLSTCIELTPVFFNTAQYKNAANIIGENLRQFDFLDEFQNCDGQSAYLQGNLYHF